MLLKFLVFAKLLVHLDYIFTSRLALSIVITIQKNLDDVLPGSFMQSCLTLPQSKEKQLIEVETCTLIFYKIAHKPLLQHPILYGPNRERQSLHRCTGKKLEKACSFPISLFETCRADCKSREIFLKEYWARASTWKKQLRK